MELLVQQVVNGLGLTGPILLVAVALSSSIAAARIINVAVGAVYVLVTVVAVKYLGGAPSWVLLAFVLLGPVAVMLVLEFAAFRWQRARATDLEEVEQSSFALTASVASVLIAVTGAITEGQPVGLPADTLRFGGRVSIGGVAVQVDAVAIFLLALAVALGWAQLLRRTRIGKLFRAVAQDYGLARSVGIRVQNVAVTGAVITGLLLGLAACMALVRVRVVGTESATAFLLLPFAAVLIGGLGELGGAVVASIGFGLLYSVIATFVSNPAYQDVTVFALLFLVLMVRPGGVSLSLPARRRRVTSG